MSRSVVFLFAALTFCAHPPDAAGEVPSSKFEGAPGPCDLEPSENCGAGALPRITEREWSAAQVRALIEQTRRGTAAVARDDKAIALVPECRLDGAYVEVEGEPGSARLWVTNRILFVSGELPKECAAATHAVVAYALGKNDQFNAILVPLPCPPATDARPAAGCVGKGLDGAARLSRARALAAQGASSSVENALEGYALAPDQPEGLELLPRAASGKDGDCALEKYSAWIGDHFRLVRRGREISVTRLLERKPPLELFESHEGAGGCSAPVFLRCFPKMFDPAPAGPGCWARARPQAAR